jgi:hypothetical protein
LPPSKAGAEVGHGLMMATLSIIIRKERDMRHSQPDEIIRYTSQQWLGQVLLPHVTILNVVSDWDWQQVLDFTRTSSISGAPDEHS